MQPGDDDAGGAGVTDPEADPAAVAATPLPPPPPPPPSKGRVARAREWLDGPVAAGLLEAIALAVVLALALTYWPRTALPDGLNLPSPPWWGGGGDLLLEGPDAAQWAENAQRMAEAAYSQLDPHRMPSWLLAVGALVRCGWTVVTAGHLVNRAMFLFAGFGTYAFGRAIGGRATGVIAAATVLAHPHLLLGTQRYGIDAAIEAMLPLAMAASMVTTWRWWLGLPAGIVVGWVLFLHATTLPFVVPALLLAALAGQPGWRRAAGVGALGAGIGLLAYGLTRIHAIPTGAELLQVVMEGAHAGSTVNGGGGPSGALLDGIGPKIAAAMPSTSASLAKQVTNPYVTPFAALWLLWIGVVAPFLVTRPALGLSTPARARGGATAADRVEGTLRAGHEVAPSPWPAITGPGGPVMACYSCRALAFERLRLFVTSLGLSTPARARGSATAADRVEGTLRAGHEAAPSPWPAVSEATWALARELVYNTVVGLVVVAGLMPLPLLTALGAPSRYGDNFTPLAAVLVARGMIALVSAPERLLRRFLPFWPAGLVGAVVAGMVAHRASQSVRPTPPLDDGMVGLYLLSRSLHDAFPPSTKVACPPTEALMQAGLQDCGPFRCPVESSDAAVETCLRTMAAGCGAKGTIGYVSLAGHQMYDPALPGRVAMDAWVAARVRPTATLRYGAFAATVYAIPTDVVPH